jgi:hypothetical protein
MAAHAFLADDRARAQQAQGVFALHPAASIRALPLHPPQLGELALPPGIEALTKLPHGLVLIGGPTGSGKTTTLAALVDVINREGRKTHRDHRGPHRIRASPPAERGRAHREELDSILSNPREGQ